MIFFLLVHIPLSRYNSYVCFVTSLLPVMLNIKTQYWFYERVNDVVYFFFRFDKEAINYVQKPKNLKYKSESKESNATLGENQTAGSGIVLAKLEIEMQESSAMATVIYLSIFFSLLINYGYSMFLQELIVS